MANPDIVMTVKYFTDPVVAKVFALGVSNPEFRAVFKKLVQLDRAFVFVGADNQNKTVECLSLCLHPSDELLDAYYMAMGV